VTRFLDPSEVIDGIKDATNSFSAFSASRFSLGKELTCTKNASFLFLLFFSETSDMNKC